MQRLTKTQSRIDQRVAENAGHTHAQQTREEEHDADEKRRQTCYLVCWPIFEAAAARQRDFRRGCFVIGETSWRERGGYGEFCLKHTLSQTHHYGKGREFYYSALL